MRNSGGTYLVGAVLAAALGTLIAASCGGSDTNASGGSNAGGGGFTTASIQPTGGSNPGGSNPGGSGGSGTAGSTGTAGGGGTGGGINPGMLDCSAPTGTLGGLKLTPFITSGLDHPVELKPIPGDPTRMVIVGQSGALTLVKNGAVAGKFLDLAGIINFDNSEQGFLSVAFHPDYQQNGRFFVYYSAKNTSLMTVAEYARDTDDAAKPMATQVLLTQNTFETNHNGGTLAFGPMDKFLYVTWGDGGSGCDTDDGNPTFHGKCGNGQNKQVLLGKILRIDVDHTEGSKKYKPAGSGINGALPEIWDYGLRNPFRVSFDGCNGDLWIGDVGQNTHEEIDHEPAGQGGKNYGWRCVEGSEPNTCNNDGCDCSGPFVAPVVSLDRSIAQTVIGGYVYRGSAIPALRGKYLFTDTGAHKVWILDPTDSYAFQADGNGNHFFGNGTISEPVSFGQDLKGELYVVDLNGQVYRVDTAN